MRPDQSGVMVSVERNGQTQFLKVIELKPDVTWETMHEIDQAARKLNTYWELVKYQHGD